MPRARIAVEQNSCEPLYPKRISTIANLERIDRESQARWSILPSKGRNARDSSQAASPRTGVFIDAIPRKSTITGGDDSGWTKSLETSLGVHAAVESRGRRRPRMLLIPSQVSACHRRVPSLPDLELQLSLRKVRQCTRYRCWVGDRREIFGGDNHSRTSKDRTEPS